MRTEELDNPIWHALTGPHRDFALGDARVVRYPADVAPFLAVADADVDLDDALEPLIPAGDQVLLLGVAPRVPPGWRLEAFPALAQMIRSEPLPVPDGPDILPLDERHREDVLALIARVYPHYFRSRTMALGRYFGIYEDGHLSAMIGERLGSAGFRELSAICTRPECNGRGLARRLTAMLTNDVLAGGRTPFLHVSHANERAVRTYAGLGFSLRADIGFWSLQRG